ncbi:hypothetical protein BLNAU_13570 [Blattamonas nauphoetae]|uniref:Uncharacterized protein n=1 Tax=Blattamonas nauphoetae TaxID=2049346 RepID=A0ABQ9XGF8_9EUKA|nr:hypothetical protein BLNAU_13570 [Blattamonas nauphoetae]
MWFILALLVETFSFDTVDCTRWNIERTVAKTLKLVVSTDTPATLKHSTDSGRGNQLRISTNHLIDFILTELGQACTVQVTSTAIRRFVGQNRPKQGCHPLTLLVIALTAAPPSHHLRILTINVEFFSNCEKTVEFNAPFVKRLLSALPIILFPLELTLCLFVRLHVTVQKRPVSSDHHRSRTGPQSPAPSAEPARARTFLPLLRAQQIAERLLEIEQRHPLHPLAQGTHATTQSDGTTLAPHVGRNGKADASTGVETNVVQVLDVLHVQRIVVLYPLIFVQLKERGTSLFRNEKQANQTMEMLLPSLVSVCSVLAPLLKTVDCFPLVRLVLSFCGCKKCVRISPDSLEDISQAQALPKRTGWPRSNHNGNDDRSSRYLTSFRKKGYLYIDLEVGYHQELYHAPFVAV